jgi:flagellar motility protein MotE (MotC chaperone)
MTYRLLPLLVIVTGLALGARVGGLWGSLTAIAEARHADETFYLELAAGDEPEEAPDLPEASAALDQGAEAAQLDILSLSDSEIALLQSLAARREEIERRGRQLAEREGLLVAAEERINARIAQLEELKAHIKTRLAEYDDQTEAQYASLVKIYENMKPKKAGRIFEELEMEVLLPVVERMRERKVAPILEKMDPTKAKSITHELAARRELPLARE